MLLDHNYFTFSSNRTRSTSHHKRVHKLVRTNVTKNSYFYRLCSPPYRPQSQFHIPLYLKLFYWNHFVNNFDPNNSCTLHFLCPWPKCVCTKGHSYNIPLTTDDECTRHATLATHYQLAQSILKIGLALAKKAG